MNWMVTLKTFGLIEVGSTFSKAYVVEGPAVNAIGMCGIPFKQNYEDNGTVLDSDLTALADYAKEVLASVARVHIYGTSIFRVLPPEEISRVRSRLDGLGDVTFDVVSAVEENRYTSFGATIGLKVDGNVGVMVGGGGSTEVAIYNADSLVDEALSSFGVGDVNRAFPDLSANVANSSREEVVEWISARLSSIRVQADVLVLAGGNFPLLYLNAGYPLKQNPYSTDPEKAYVINTVEKRARDEVYFRELELDSFRKLTPETPEWWDGTRAMCCFVDAVAQQVGAETLVPTRISMIFGIAAKLNAE